MAARDRAERGETIEKAEAATRREFGNVGLVMEATREIWGWTWIEQLGPDLRYALRMLLRSPVLTSVAVLSLALGIGANTAIFSVINALMLRRLPVRSPEQLVMLRRDDGFQAEFWRYLGFSYPHFERLRDTAQVFSDLSTISLLDRFNVTVGGPGGGLDPGQVRVALISGNYLSMLGVNARVGRALTGDDDSVPGGHPVAVISDSYWRRQFASSTDILERTLTLNGTSYDIVGVMPPGFTGDWVGRPADIWIPMMMQSQVMPEMPGLLTKGNGWLRVVARLKPGVTVQEAQAAVQTIYYRLLREQAGANPSREQMQYIAQVRLELRPAGNGFSPERLSLAQSLAILMVVAGAVLLIACANVANLLLARSEARRTEIAMRLALGAGRARLARQLLTESILLAMMGAALGLVFAALGTNVLSTVSLGSVQMDARGTSSWLSLDLHPDLRDFAFATGLCMIAGILFGLAPAYRGSMVSVSRSLMERGPSGGGSGGQFGLGRLLVISQVAVSLVLLIGAGLFVRTLRNLRSLDPGVDRQHLLLVWTAPGQTGRQGPVLARFVHAVQERISSLPGVLSASASNHGFLDGHEGGGDSERYKIEGHIAKPGKFGGRVAITPGFFETAGIPLLAGRDFTERDLDTSPHVAIINETMARFFFEDENPIGRHFGMPGDMGTPIEIVGVVKDAKFGTPRDAGLTEYWPYLQIIGLMRTMCVEVRTGGNPTAIASRVRQELHDIDPGLPVLRIDTIEEQLNDVLAQERWIAGLSVFFGAVAALLACLGLYGVISYTVARRVPEIGIRLALGAAPADVLGMVLKESMLLVVAGVAIGVPVTLAAARLISARLYGVSAADPLTIAAAASLMTAVAALAGFLPAWRASRVDPMIALRYE